jgi:hypothetical protein
MRSHNTMLGIALGLALIAGDTADRAAAQVSANTALLQIDRLDHVDVFAAEPMVVRHPAGKLFVAGYRRNAEASDLWHSSDDGKSWRRIDFGPAAAGLLGNSDVDLAVSHDGVVYFANMSFDAKLSHGTQIAVASSRDAGESWTWSLLARTQGADRPWVKVAPDGTAHVVWNDGNGVLHTTSRDRGTSWAAASRIHHEGGSSHLAVSRNGSVAVRIIPLSASGNKIHPEAELIAVSRNGGKDWTKHNVPGRRTFRLDGDTSLLPRWVEPIAWDSEGRLHYLWTTPEALWLASSGDAGKTWREWRLLDGGPVRYFPYLAAGENGQLAATWFSGHDNELQAHVASIAVQPNRAAPLIAVGSFRPDAWRGRAEKRTRSTGGEYLAVIVERGVLLVVSPLGDREAQRDGFSVWRFSTPSR